MIEIWILFEVSCLAYSIPWNLYCWLKLFYTLFKIFENYQEGKIVNVLKILKTDKDRCRDALSDIINLYYNGLLHIYGLFEILYFFTVFLCKFSSFL